MQIYDSYTKFWNELIDSKLTDSWIIVGVTHTSNEMYAQQRENGQDMLGFQPLTVVLVNPHSQESRQLLIKDVQDEQAATVSQHARQAYLAGFDSRFGSFTPAKFHVFAEYNSWDAFYNSWLERSGQPVFMHNMPVLMDHTPQIEQWTRQQTNQDVMPYQRLLITTFFVSKNTFYDFFIKNIDDGEANRIKLLLKSRLSLSQDLLFNTTLKNHA